MKNIILLVCTSLIFGMPSLLSAGNAEWSYSGDTGPQYWASLSPEYALCGSGKNQSPINIDEKIALNAQEKGIKFNYGLITPETINNTGKYIQINVGPGANIKVDGNQFELKHLDFHMPSENTVNGKHFPMEIQFIHESKKKDLAIMSTFVVPGNPDRTLSKLLKQLPLKAGESRPLAPNSFRNIEMKKKLAGYYRYSGSLTSPPCTEGVHWFIMKQLMTMTNSQQQKFKAAIKQDNIRPVQPLNARIVIQ